jgi:glutamine amidotransferase
MGWNQVYKRQSGGLLAAIDNGTYFYFVHSYYVEPLDTEMWALEADYGQPFCAAVRRGRLFATQFHPEKSQAAGLRLLSGFAELG